MTGWVLNTQPVPAYLCRDVKINPIRRYIEMFWFLKDSCHAITVDFIFALLYPF